MYRILACIAAAATVASATPALAKNNGRGHQRVERGWADRDFDRQRQVFGADRFAQRARGCPPGLARKNNGCLPPGQARRLGVGDRLPSYLSGYNIPVRYQDRYRDGRDYSYRYDDDQIYRVNRRSGVIDEIISVLGF